MILGPYEIIACPLCGEKVMYKTFLTMTLNRFRFWTDGKMRGPEFFNVPLLIKCSKCDNFYWKKEAIELENKFLGGSRNKEAKKLTPVEYLNAINKMKLRDTEEEKFLRILTWHRLNDHYIYCKYDPVWMKPDYKFGFGQNMIKLYKLLDHNSEDDLKKKIEILRESKEYGMALSELYKNNLKDKDFSWQQIELCKNRDNRVRELKKY